MNSVRVVILNNYILYMLLQKMIKTMQKAKRRKLKAVKSSY